MVYSFIQLLTITIEITLLPYLPSGKVTSLWKITFPLDWSPPLAAHLHEGSSFVFRLGQDFFLAVKSKYYT